MAGVGQIADSQGEFEEITPLEPEVIVSTRRERKFTEKGLQYAHETKYKRLEQLFKALDKQYQSITYIMDEDSDDNEALRIFKKWLTLYESFAQTNDEYKILLSEDECAEHNSGWYRPRNDVMLEFKDTVQLWFIKKEAEAHRVKEENRSCINGSKSSHYTSMSRSSKSTHHSSTSSVRSARLKEEVKRIQLVARAQAFEEEKALEKQALELRKKQELNKLKEDIAVTEAKCKLFEEFEDHGSVLSQGTQDKTRVIVPNTSIHIHDSSSNPAMVMPSIDRLETSHDYKNRINDNGEALVSVVRRLSRPVVELKPFDGQPLKYQRFIRQFHSKVEANCDTFEEKLDYLE